MAFSVQRVRKTAYADLGKDSWKMDPPSLLRSCVNRWIQVHLLDTVQKILRGKDLRLFQEMLVQATKETCQILKANRKGANFSHKLSIVSGVTLSR